MKYIFIVFILFGLWSCSNSNETKVKNPSVNESELIEQPEKIIPLSQDTVQETEKPKVKILDQSLRERSLLALEKFPKITMYPTADGDGISSEELVEQSVDARTEPIVLDSLVRGQDLSSTFFSSYNLTDTNSRYCKFLARFQGPSQELEYMLYGIKHDGKFQGVDLLYLISLDKRHFKIVNSLHIGFSYYKSMPRYDEYEVLSPSFYINESYEIVTRYMDKGWESSSPWYIIKQKINSNGPSQPVITYYYSNDDDYYDHYQELFKLIIEGQIKVVTRTPDYRYERMEGSDDFYSNLQIQIFKDSAYYIPKIQDSVFKISDPWKRDWLEVYEYEVMDYLDSCLYRENNFVNCYKSHYLQFVYAGPNEEKYSKVFEVKYKKIGEGKVEVKTRWASKKEDLPYSDWRVIHLPQYQEGIESDEQELIYWEYEYYFDDDIPFEIHHIDSAPPSPQEILEEEQKVQLRHIHEDLKQLKPIQFTNEFVIHKSYGNNPLPISFLNDGKIPIDSTWQLEGVLGYEDEKFPGILLLYSPKNKTHYVVKYRTDQLKKVYPSSVSILPKESTIKSTNTGLEFVEITISDSKYNAKKISLDLTKKSNIRKQFKVLKEITRFKSFPEEIKYVGDSEGNLRFGNQHHIVPLVKNPREYYYDEYDRVYLRLKEFSKEEKKASYIKYYYANKTDQEPSKLLEIKYERQDDGYLHIKFRSAQKEEELLVTPFVKFVDYPKEHKKHKGWSRRYLEAKSQKELKQIVKARMKK